MLAYFTKYINPSLSKSSLKFNGSLAKLGLTSLAWKSNDGIPEQQH